MNFPITTYISLALIGFIFILASLISGRNKRRKLSGLSGIAIGLLLLSSVIEGRLIAYSLIGCGLLLAVYDFIRSYKIKNTDSE
ncbi:hypothetical protein ACFLU5_17165 [Bacteroidota bacterium]